MKDLNSAKNCFEQQLYECKKTNQWKSVLKLSEKFPHDIKSYFLWCWPSEFCLNYLRSILSNLGISTVLSIGSGSGLLEWILTESLGLKIVGLEVDSGWWSSRYSPEPFIPLKFVNPSKPITSNFLQETMTSESGGDSWNFALLFCYFNSRAAFNDYLDAFKGRYIIMIGPSRDCERFTACDPLDPKFADNQQFKMVHFSEIGDNRDHIAIYERINV